jgi:hypothetical protein
MERRFPNRHLPAYVNGDLQIIIVNLFFPIRIQRQRNMLNFRNAERAFGA